MLHGYASLYAPPPHLLNIFLTPDYPTQWVSAICGLIHFFVNSKALKNRQTVLESWHMVATFVYTTIL